MEVGSQEDEWHVDSGQVVGEPARQVDVRDRAALGADALSDLRERTPESVCNEDHALASDSPGGDRSTSIDRLLNPAQSTYTMQDSIENHASVWTS
jgi:hypothetical protein